MLWTIPSWFRRHFVGTLFWYRETWATCLASGGNRRFQFSNNGGRGRSRDQIIWISFFKFFKFSLPHHISSRVNVFNHSFWKLYIKTINDLDPGLNVPELLHTAILKSENSVSTNIYLTKVCWKAGKKQGFCTRNRPRASSHEPGWPGWPGFFFT